MFLNRIAIMCKNRHTTLPLTRQPVGTEAATGSPFRFFAAEMLSMSGKSTYFTRCKEAPIIGSLSNMPHAQHK